MTMEDTNKTVKAVGASAITGLPTIVCAVLIALRHVGLTSMSYWSIILFTLEVWVALVGIILGIWMLFMAIGAIAALLSDWF